MQGEGRRIDDGHDTRSRRTRMRVMRGGIAGPTVNVQLTEVSRAGVGLVHADPLQVGDQLLLVSPEEQGSPGVLMFTVSRCAPRAEGDYATSAEFTRLVLRRPAPCLTV